MFPYLLILYVFPFVSFISFIYFRQFIWNMKDSLLQDILYRIYYDSFFLAPVTCILQFIYLISLLIISFKQKDNKWIVICTIALMLNLLSSLLTYFRIVATAAGIG
jgi:hypothetical protein